MSDSGPMDPSPYLTGEAQTPPVYPVEPTPPPGQPQQQQAPQPQAPPVDVAYAPFPAPSPTGDDIGPESYAERMLAHINRLDQQDQTQQVPTQQPQQQAPPAAPPAAPTSLPPSFQQPPDAQQTPPSGAPVTTTPGGQGQGDGGGLTTPVAPSPTTPSPTTPQPPTTVPGTPPPAPPPTTVSIDETLERLYGRQLDYAEKQAMINAYIDLSQLDDRQMGLLQQALNGELQDQPAPQQQAPQVPGQPAPQGQQPVFQTGNPEIDEYLAPAIAPLIQQTVAPLQTQLAEMHEQMEQDRQRQMQEQQVAINRGLEEGVQTFRQQHPYLTDQDVLTLTAIARRDALFPRYLQAGRSPADAANEMLTHAFTMDPKYREQQAAATLAQQQQQALIDAQRQQTAASLNPSGGAVPIQGMTEDELLVQEITQAINQGQPSMN